MVCWIIVECIAKGKVHKKYGSGVKVIVAPQVGVSADEPKEIAIDCG